VAPLTQARAEGLLWALGAGRRRWPPSSKGCTGAYQLASAS
jgi:hypothetical protein